MDNVAGIDVSKGKSMVSLLRPFGEVVAKPFSVGHTGSELKELANYLKSLDGETWVVLEHTGRYYEPVARFLHEEGIFVSAVNPKLIKDYGYDEPCFRTILCWSASRSAALALWFWNRYTSSGSEWR